MFAVVTGGGGYVGHRLGLALAASGQQVLLLDLVTPSAPLAPGLRFACVDVCDEQALVAAFAGADAVFHLASFGMSGGQQLLPALIEAVNVGGTRAVLGACLAAGVPRLVYLSTYNVVYGGQRIENGDESLPYFPLHRHPDAYSRTKAVAEQLVLAANMSPLPGQPGQHLRTCALRPAGIYGPGEQRHLPRIVRYLELGLFSFVIGPPHEGIVDWLHVDNLIQAMLLAAEALAADKQHVAAGQAYFIHDDQPGVTSRVNNFEFLRPLVEGLGYPFPRLVLPAPLAYRLAFLLECLHRALLPLCDLSRLFILTRAEVLKSSGTHWFSVDKARRELGYAPVRHSFKPVVQWFVDRGHGRRPHGRKQWGAARHRSVLGAAARTFLVPPMVACAVLLLQLALTIVIGWLLGKATGM
ncbi:hypothetical protein ABPG77_008177 [Micractinium sp. CCAP 211/92]